MPIKNSMREAEIRRLHAIVAEDPETDLAAVAKSMGVTLDAVKRFMPESLAEAKAKKQAEIAAAVAEEEKQNAANAAPPPPPPPASNANKTGDS